MKDPAYRLNFAYKEIRKLSKMLDDAGITHRLVRRFDGWQIGYPVLPLEGDYVCSVIQNRISYGSEDDLLEIRGLLTDEEAACDSVAGYLTAEDVFGRIKTHWEANKSVAGLE